MKLKSLWQIVRFGVAGVASVATYALLYYTFSELIGIWYVTSSVIATVLKRCIGFFIQKFWTFRNSDKKTIPQQAGLYIAMLLSLMFLNSAAIWVLVEKLQLDQKTALFIPIVPLGVISFLTHRKIFKTNNPDKST